MVWTGFSADDSVGEPAPFADPIEAIIIIIKLII